MLDPLILLALAAVGMLAGFVDAIAGGGGMIALPALLSAGLPPVSALATNKLQSVFGTGMAALTYWRRGFVSLKALVPAIALTYAGSLVGALVVKQIDISLLDVAVPVGRRIPPRALKWLQQFAEANNRMLLYSEQIMENGRYTVQQAVSAYGPPEFQQDMAAAMRAGQSPEEALAR